MIYTERRLAGRSGLARPAVLLFSVVTLTCAQVVSMQCRRHLTPVRVASRRERYRANTAVLEQCTKCFDVSYTATRTPVL